MALNSRALGGNVDPSEAIQKELETGLNVDVTSHENIGQLPPLSKCGLSFKPSREKRIVGGRPVEPGEAPWMAQLYLHNNTFGTGTQRMPKFFNSLTSSKKT